MAVDKLVDSTQLNADLTSIANAIRTKGGTSESLAFPSGFVSAVEAIPSGGETVYYESRGQMHTKNMIVSSENAQYNYAYCDYLETISFPNASNAGGVYNCLNLKEVSAPKKTTYDSNYWIRQQGSEYNKLEKITIGSIGYPVTSIGTIRWRYGCHAMELVVECYVDANSIADVPTAVSTNINGDNSYAPTGSVVTIIYRNSTTGEVLA